MRVYISSNYDKHQLPCSTMRTTEVPNAWTTSISGGSSALHLYFVSKLFILISIGRSLGLANTGEST